MNRFARFRLSMVLAGLALAAASSDVAAAGARPGKLKGDEQSHMAASGTHLRLIVSPRDQTGGRLLPEQSAFFNITLRNEGSEAVRAFALDGNDTSPVFRVYDHNGNVLVEATHSTLIDRFGADMGEPIPQEPILVGLGPGEAATTFVDLWSYTDPLPKGRYEFGAAHRVGAGSGDWIESNRLAFDVVDAVVSEAVLGYENVRRDSSLTVWVAQPEGKDQPQLLARLSAIGNQATAQRSGRALGPVAPGSRVAIGGKPPEGTPTDEGWFAVAGPGSVEVIQHFRTNPQWRSGPFEVPFANPHPVPGFPDRRHAVALFWGERQDGVTYLAGFVVSAREGVKTQWTLPLASPPSLIACLFSETGPIALLLATGGNQGVQLSRIDIDEAGKIVAAERIVRSSPDQLLAVAVDQRPEQPQMFYALEGEARRPDHLTLVRIPLAGEPRTHDFGAVPGWPVSEGRPERATRLDFTVGWDGIARLALLDRRGDYFAGPLDGSPLLQVADAVHGPRVALPLVAALRGDLSYSGFTGEGHLVYLGGR
jgi:hypothetical protein